MSTGDQSQYIRSKLAERGSTRGAKFMRDGFDMWAESETPAREGQMPKMASEPMEESYGGAMTVHHAKKLSKKLKGGVIPDAVKNAISEAKKLIQLWRDVSSWIDEFDMDLKDEIIDNPAVTNANVKTVATQLRTLIANLRGYKDILDGVAALAGSVGLGKHQPEMHGGVKIEDVGKYISNIASMYMWLRNAKTALEQILKLRSLQPYGQKFLDAVNPILKYVGLGKKKKCCHGGAEEMVSPGLTFEDVTPKGGRRRSAQIAMPRGTAPSDQHVSTMPYQYGGMSTMPYEEDDSESYSGGAVSTMPYEDGADSYYSAGKPPRRKGGRKVGGAQKMSVGQADAQQAAQQAAMMAARHIGSFNPSQKIGGRKPSARGAIVKKVMQEQGLSLPQASKYVKEHGLY